MSGKDKLSGDFQNSRFKSQTQILQDWPFLLHNQHWSYSEPRRLKMQSIKKYSTISTTSTTGRCYVGATLMRFLSIIEQLSQSEPRTKNDLRSVLSIGLYWSCFAQGRKQLASWGAGGYFGRDWSQAEGPLDNLKKRERSGYVEKQKKVSSRVGVK